MAHKGITCPKCATTSFSDPDDFGFNYVADVQVLRSIGGINSEGGLRIDAMVEDLTEDENPRLCCHTCHHEFSLPDDVCDKIEWIS